MLTPLAGTQPSVSSLCVPRKLTATFCSSWEQVFDPINSAASHAQAPVTYGSAPLDLMYSPNLTSKFLAVGGASPCRIPSTKPGFPSLARDSGDSSFCQAPNL